MASFIIPLVWIRLPCYFDKIQDKGVPDLSELGIKPEEEINEIVLQLDQINGYVRHSKGKVCFWSFGYRFICAMDYEHFDMLIREKTKELNKLMGAQNE